jgi:hypothetical protein
LSFSTGDYRFDRRNGLDFLFILAVGLVAGTLSGIVGTGSSIMLMPVLIYEYGPKQAVPIMAIAAVMANLSRILPGGARSTGEPAPPIPLLPFPRPHLARVPCSYCRRGSSMFASACS